MWSGLWRTKTLHIILLYEKDRDTLIEQSQRIKLDPAWENRAYGHMKFGHIWSLITFYIDMVSS